MLKDELKHIDKSDDAVKKTGLTVGAVLILISFLLWYLGKTSFIYFSIIGGLFVIPAFIAIPVLRPFHRLWMMLALLMGSVMSRVILTLLYYFVLTPIGLLAKLVGKKFIPLQFDRKAATYWEKSEKIVKQKIDYERQF